jgi:hypothetical protein
MSRYWLGGSPCAGKSSVARLLAARYGIEHFECDAVLGVQRSPRFARSPRWQADREVAFYRAQFGRVVSELPAGPALVEGADLLPSCLHELGVPPSRAIWLVPTPSFQRRWYAAREWVTPYLSGYPDPAAAFESWMRRDELFAEHVRVTATAAGYRVMVVDGSRTIPETAGIIEAHLSLRPRKLSEPSPKLPP